MTQTPRSTSFRRLALAAALASVASLAQAQDIRIAKHGGYMFWYGVLMLVMLSIALVALYLDAHRGFDATYAEMARSFPDLAGQALKEATEAKMKERTADAEGTIDREALERSNATLPGKK